MAEDRTGRASADTASPLGGLAPLQGRVSLVERAGLGALNLRGSGPAFLAAVERALGVGLPAEPNTTARRADLLLLWLGPDEWLLRLLLVEVEARMSTLRDAISKMHAAVADVSDRACVLRLSGQAARDVLAEGCPLDLHPRVFRPGACAQSRYGKAALLVDQVDAGPTYDLQTPRSCARYLWESLAEAGREHS